MKFRLAIGCFFALLVLSLSGCAGIKPAQRAAAPNTLHAVRYSIVGNHFAPLDIVIHDATQVRALYDAAYALAKNDQQGDSNCPQDNGIEYHLNFLHGTTLVQQMDLDSTGCRRLDLNTAAFDFAGIIDTHDVRATTPAFRAMVAKMLNLPSLNPSNYF